MKKKCENLSLHFFSTLAWRQPLSAAKSKNFSFNHAIYMQTLYDSLRFIICDMELKFSEIVNDALE